jgi:hypothetical protein
MSGRVLPQRHEGWSVPVRALVTGVRLARALARQCDGRLRCKQELSEFTQCITARASATRATADALLDRRRSFSFPSTRGEQPSKDDRPGSDRERAYTSKLELGNSLSAPTSEIRPPRPRTTAKAGSSSLTRAAEAIRAVPKTALLRAETIVAEADLSPQCTNLSQPAFEAPNHQETGQTLMRRRFKSVHRRVGPSRHHFGRPRRLERPRHIGKGGGT